MKGTLSAESYGPGERSEQRDLLQQRYFWSFILEMANTHFRTKGTL